MTDREPRKRWLPRLTLRALMLLILLASFWLVRQVNKAREQRAVVAAVKKFGGWVHYGPDFVGADPVYLKSPSAPAWLRRWVGEEYFQDLTHVSLAYDDTNKVFQENNNENDCSEILSQLSSINELKSLWMKKWQATDEGLGLLRKNESLEALAVFEARMITDKGVMQLKDLKNIKHLLISGSKMTDAGLLAIAGMKRLKHLSLEGLHGTKSEISDVGLAVLQGLTNLETLNLSYTRVTDKGLVNLSGLKRLRNLRLAHCDISDKGIDDIINMKLIDFLDVSGTQVTDEGLACLRGLPKLKFLLIYDSRVTPQGIQKLKAALPKVTVF